MTAMIMIPSNEYFDDTDCDGVLTVDDCDDNNPTPRRCLWMETVMEC